MGADSKIEWTHHTFNPWRGCTKVSPGCAHCYAETMSKRNPSVLGVWGDDGTRVVAAESYWRQPAKWNAEAKAAGERRRVFCASLADVFEDRPELVQPRVRLFHLISETPHLDWLLLTKRPENVRRFHGGDGVPRSWPENMPANVWLGVSVEDQARADERIPLLLQTPAAVRFLSCEPLLGPVDLRPKAPDAYAILGRFYSTGTFDPSGMSPAADRVLNCFPNLDWVIVGGESGPGARPMHPNWALSLRDQCQAAGVAFHFKQWGEWEPTTMHCDERCPAHARGTPHVFDGQGTTAHRSFADGSIASMTVGKSGRTDCHRQEGDVLFLRVGKNAAGRLLDGRTWDEFPEVSAHA